jgi:hypothetical protein
VKQYLARDHRQGLAGTHLEDERHLRREEDGDLAPGVERQVRRKLPRLLLDQHDGDERLAGTCGAINSQVLMCQSSVVIQYMFQCKLTTMSDSTFGWRSLIAVGCKALHALCICAACLIDSPVSRKAMTCDTNKHPEVCMLKGRSASSMCMKIWIARPLCTRRVALHFAHFVGTHPETAPPDTFSAETLRLSCFRMPYCQAERCHALWCAVPERAEH